MAPQINDIEQLYLCVYLFFAEHAGPALEEFLDCIGHRVRLQGFDKYRGGLDNKSKFIDN